MLEEARSVYEQLGMEEELEQVKELSLMLPEEIAE
jgi:hypothetical protein